MAYTNNTPQATDRVSDTQDPILQNFVNIPTLIGANHVGFDGTANEGKHTVISAVEQGAPPATAVDEVALFSQLSTLSAQSELAIRKENNGAVTEFTSLGTGPTGWSYLPSGLLMKWGFTGAISGQTNILFSTVGTTPAFTSVYQIMPFVFSVAAGDVDSAVRLTSLGPLDFDVYVSNRSTTNAATTPIIVRYIALGH